MTTSPVASLRYATKTLEETPGRVLRLLVAVAHNPSIRLALGRRGYSQAEHQLGWALLERVCGLGDEAFTVVDQKANLEALVEIDARDEQDFRVVHATLWHRFPEQARFVLTGIGPSEGPAAAVGMKELLDRLDQLETDPAREATRREDHAALDLVAQRGFTPVARKTLREKVDRALACGASQTAQRTTTEERKKATRPVLEQLRAWYDEWHDIAEVAISRADQRKEAGVEV